MSAGGAFTNLSDIYQVYYSKATANYSLLDFLRAIVIMFMPPLACIRHVVTLRVQYSSL